MALNITASRSIFSIVVPVKCLPKPTRDKGLPENLSRTLETLGGNFCIDSMEYLWRLSVRHIRGFNN
jgi:hypothetical protein